GGPSSRKRRAQTSPRRPPGKSPPSPLLLRPQPTQPPHHRGLIWGANQTNSANTTATTEPTTQTPAAGQPPTRWSRIPSSSNTLARILLWGEIHLALLRWK